MRMLQLILLAIIIFLLLKLTTFGWQGFAKSQVVLPKDKELAERLKTHVIKLSRDIGERSIFEYPNLIQAADYITEQFKNLGLKVEFQEYTVYGKAVKNIIAKKMGKEKAGEVIILGAHYDTCFNPGANDNASAIAGLLEIARLAASQDYSRTVKFIAFVNEEPPFFKTPDMGSCVYLEQAGKEKENIKIAIILETIGYYSDKLFSQRYPLFLGPFYPNRANFIAIVGNFSVSRWVKRITKYFKEHSGLPIATIALFNFIPGVDFSDHWSFWQEGFPALMVTDTAFYRSPHYHKDSDTYEKLDYRSLASAIEGLEGVLSELAI